MSWAGSGMERRPVLGSVGQSLEWCVLYWARAQADTEFLPGKSNFGSFTVPLFSTCLYGPEGL